MTAEKSKDNCRVDAAVLESTKPGVYLLKQKHLPSKYCSIAKFTALTSDANGVIQKVKIQFRNNGVIETKTVNYSEFNEPEVLLTKLKNKGFKIYHEDATFDIFKSYHRINLPLKKLKVSLTESKPKTTKNSSESSIVLTSNFQNDDYSYSERTSLAPDNNRKLQTTKIPEKNDSNHVNSSPKVSVGNNALCERTDVQKRTHGKKTDVKNVTENVKITGGVGKSRLNDEERKRLSNKQVLIDNKQARNQLRPLKADKATKVSIPNLVAQIYPPIEIDNTNLSVTVKCDRLALTWDIGTYIKDELEQRIKDLSKSFNGHAYLKLVSIRGKENYRINLKILTSDGKHLGFMQFDPVNANSNYCRIDLNPNAIGIEGIEEIKRLLRHLIGDDYFEYLLDGNITRLDIAIDITGVEPNDLLFFSSSRANTSEIWGFSSKGGKTESFITHTQAIGSRESNVFAQMYNKILQLWQAKGVAVDGKLTRIEIRLNKPRNKGKGGVAIKVKHLPLIENPLTAFDVAHYPAPDGSYGFEFFISHVRLHGADKALKMIKDRRIRVLYSNMILEHRADWWQPDLLWAQFIADLKNTGLFPAEIFEEPTDEVR